MGGQRKLAARRCAGCGVHLALCRCAELPRVETSFDVLVVRNDHERGKPTNTARLIPAMLAHARLIPFAVRGELFDAASLREPQLDYLLLFPRGEPGEPDAAPPYLSATSAGSRSLDEPGRRRALVLLDGTWGQCSRMSRRIPEIAAMPAFRLPPGPPGHWGGVRSAADPSRLCTLEALIRAVAILDGPACARPLQAHFDRVAAAMLFMKGKLPAPTVPPEWR